MRVSVNLATRPFVELRAFFLRLRWIMAGLAAVALALMFVAHAFSAKAAKQQAELDRLRDQTIAAQQAKLHTEQRMRQPGNAAVLDRAHFLNALFLRKSFSWTAVMMDLEDVLPAGVQVTSLEPAVTADGQVTIRLRVAGERARAVQLVRNLERSRRFLEPRLGSESAQNKEGAGANGQRSGAASAPNGSGFGAQAGGTGAAPGTFGTPPGTPLGSPAGVEFEILAEYNPLPAGQPYAASHGRAPSVDSPTTAIPKAPMRIAAQRPAATGLNAGTNVGRGYPRHGVILAPYGSGLGNPVQPGGGAR